MHRSIPGPIVATSALCLLAGCGGGGDATANVAAKAECTSTAGDADYAGFSGGQIADFAKQRDKMMDTAKAGDPTAWREGAENFAKYFLGKIALEPNSLCSNDYKTIQSLMAAEMDFESRAPEQESHPLDKDQTADYARVLYETAGLTEARGEKHLDTKVRQTIDGVANTRSSWGK